jgi:hypothetical protein
MKWLSWYEIMPEAKDSVHEYVSVLSIALRVPLFSKIIIEHVNGRFVSLM